MLIFVLCLNFLYFQYKTACDLFKVNMYNTSNTFWNGFLTLDGPLDYETASLYQVPLTLKVISIIALQLVIFISLVREIIYSPFHIVQVSEFCEFLCLYHEEKS